MSNFNGYSEMLNLPTTPTTLAVLTGKTGVWADVELTINADSIAYIGTIPIPAGTSQTRTFRLLNLESLSVRTAAPESSSVDTICVSMVETAQEKSLDEKGK